MVIIVLMVLIVIMVLLALRSPQPRGNRQERLARPNLRIGLCYHYNHYRVYHLGPDEYVIGLISFLALPLRGPQPRGDR